MFVGQLNEPKTLNTVKTNELAHPPHASVMSPI